MNSKYLIGQVKNKNYLLRDLKKQYTLYRVDNGIFEEVFSNSNLDSLKGEIKEHLDLAPKMIRKHIGFNNISNNEKPLSRLKFINIKLGIEKLFQPIVNQSK